MLLSASSEPELLSSARLIIKVLPSVGRWKSHWPLFVQQLSPNAHMLASICLVQSHQRLLQLSSDDRSI